MALNPGQIDSNGDWSPADQDSLGRLLEKKLVSHGLIEIHPGHDPGKLQRRRFLLALSEAIIEHLKTHGEVLYAPPPVTDIDQFTISVNPSVASGMGHTHTVNATLTLKHASTPGKIK